MHYCPARFAGNSSSAPSIFPSAIIMQMWQCPLLLLSVSLIAAINTQQMPSQRLEPNQVAELVEQQQQQQQHQAHTQQQQQPQQQQTREVSKAENKV